MSRVSKFPLWYTLRESLPDKKGPGILLGLEIIP